MFEELTQTFKIKKLLNEKTNTSKEAKEILNEIVSLTNAYVIAVLSEISRDGNNKENDINKIFATILKRRNESTEQN